MVITVWIFIFMIMLLLFLQGDRVGTANFIYLALVMLFQNSVRYLNLHTLLIFFEVIFWFYLLYLRKIKLSENIFLLISGIVLILVLLSHGMFYALPINIKHTIWSLIGAILIFRFSHLLGINREDNMAITLVNFVFIGTALMHLNISYVWPWSSIMLLFYLWWLGIIRYHRREIVWQLFMTIALFILLFSYVHHNEEFIFRWFPLLAIAFSLDYLFTNRLFINRQTVIIIWSSLFISIYYVVKFFTLDVHVVHDLMSVSWLLVFFLIVLMLLMFRVGYMIVNLKENSDKLNWKLLLVVFLFLGFQVGWNL